MLAVGQSHVAPCPLDEARTGQFTAVSTSPFRLPVTRGHRLLSVSILLALLLFMQWENNFVLHSLIKLGQKRQIEMTVFFKKMTSSLQGGIWGYSPQVRQCRSLSTVRALCQSVSLWVPASASQLLNVAAASSASESLLGLSLECSPCCTACCQGDLCTRLCLDCTDSLHPVNHILHHVLPWPTAADLSRDAGFGLHERFSVCCSWQQIATGPHPFQMPPSKPLYPPLGRCPGPVQDFY